MGKALDPSLADPEIVFPQYAKTLRQYLAEMTPVSVQTYAARWVLPMDAPPIENGEVVVEDGLIAAVRPRHASGAPDSEGGGQRP